MKKLIIYFIFIMLLAVQLFGLTGKQIIEKTGVKGGVIVHLDCNDAKLTLELRVNDRYLVQGLDTDPKDVEKARRNIMAKGVYGKVTASVFDEKKLPYADNFVNLVVAESPGKVPQKEIMRVLAPGGIAYITSLGISYDRDALRYILYSFLQGDKAFGPEGFIKSKVRLIGTYQVSGSIDNSPVELQNIMPGH